MDDCKWPMEISINTRATGTTTHTFGNTAAVID